MPFGLLLSPTWQARREITKDRSSGTANGADSIYSGMILEDLDRYQEELSPLETMYRDRIMGPQAEKDRSSMLQSVGQHTDNAFGRAVARVNERRRAAGLSGDMSADDKRRLQVNQQSTKAKNTTDFARFYDRMTTEML